MLYGYIIIISSLLLLIGYSIGRRVGIKEGVEKGKTLNAIYSKQESYYTNICPMCKTNYINKD